MNTCIKDILDKRGLSKLVAPLWKLKLSKAEFESIKKQIIQTYSSNKRFDSCRTEAALYYAEWYKRLCVKSDRKGGISREDVFESLGIDGDKKVAFKFCEAALEGLKRIPGHEIINIGSERHVYSLLFQGGIPLQNICSDTSSTNWDRLIRGLILRDYDFSALQNESAKYSHSLEEYCDTLKDASERDSIEDIPFYCEDEEGRLWYEFLTGTIKKTRDRINREHPFRIAWEFEIDEVDREADAFPVNIYYKVTGPQTLSKEFLKSNERDSFCDHSISVNIDSQRVYGETYIDNFIYRKFFFRAPYSNGGYVNIQFDGSPVELESDSIDLNIPHIVYKDKDGKFKLGNRIGSVESRIFFSREWTIAEEQTFESHNVLWDGNVYSMIIVPAGYNGKITFIHSHTGDPLEFAINTPLYWTEISHSGNESGYFKEQLFTPGKCKIYKVSETEKQRHSSLIFREKFSHYWTEQPSIGLLYARPKSKVFVSPISIYNLGTHFKVDAKPGKDFFDIKFTWPYGTVKPEYGVKNDDNYWRIRKEECSGRQFISCTFIPESSPSKAFTLHLKTQFIDFNIYDTDGHAIEDNDVIPICDVNLYTYDFRCSAKNDETILINFSGSKTGYSATHLGSDLAISDVNTKNSWRIPSQGSLDKLLGNMEVVKNEVRAHSNTLKIIIRGHTNRQFLIRERPFRIEKDDEKRALWINEWNKKRRQTYKGDLFLFPLDGTRTDMITLKRSEDGLYILPEVIPDKFLVCENNYTSTLGRLEVRMHIAGSERINRAEESQRIQQKILGELRNDSFGTERWKEALYWLKQSNKHSIPANKLHDLQLCASSDMLLVLLAFHAFMEHDYDEVDELIENLLLIEDNLKIKWWFIKLKCYDVCKQYISTDGFKIALYNYLVEDCISTRNKELYRILTDDDFKIADFCKSNDVKFFSDQVLRSFKNFMVRLAIASHIKGSRLDWNLTHDFYKDLSHLIENKCSDNITYVRSLIQSVEYLEETLSALKLDKKTKKHNVTNIQLNTDAKGEFFCRVTCEDLCGERYHYDNSIDDIFGKQVFDIGKLEPFYSSDLPEDKDTRLFGKTTDNYCRLVRRIEVLSDYLSGKTDMMFYHNEDLTHIGTSSEENQVNNCKAIRGSVIYYLERDREIFLQYLRNFIHNHLS